MGDWPKVSPPTSPIIWPFANEVYGQIMAGGAAGTSFGSLAWPAADRALFMPFTLTNFALVRQFLFYVGATSAGNIDVGIYDSALNRVMSSGLTAMSASTSAIQELNVTDQWIPPGAYYLAATCTSGTGTCFRATYTDELHLPSLSVYEQALGAGTALPVTATPVVTTQATIYIPAVGAQLVGTF